MKKTFKYLSCGFAVLALACLGVYGTAGSTINGSMTVSGDLTVKGTCTGCGGGLTIGSTTVSSGTSGAFLYNNAGTLGNVSVVPGTNGGGLVLIEQHSASTSSSIDFTTCFTSTYDTYQITGTGLVPGTSAQDLYMLISTDGGMNFITTGNYRWAHYTTLASVASGPAGGAGVAQIQITDNNRMVTTAGTSTSFNITLTNMLSGTKFLTAWGTQTGWVSATDLAAVLISGGYAVANTPNAIRFIMSSGTIASGEFRCYGVSKI